MEGKGQEDEDEYEEEVEQTGQIYPEQESLRQRFMNLSFSSEPGFLRHRPTGAEFEGYRSRSGTSSGERSRSGSDLRSNEEQYEQQVLGLRRMSAEYTPLTPEEEQRLRNSVSSIRLSPHPRRRSILMESYPTSPTGLASDASLIRSDDISGEITPEFESMDESIAAIRSGLAMSDRPRPRAHSSPIREQRIQTTGKRRQDFRGEVEGKSGVDVSKGAVPKRLTRLAPIPKSPTRVPLTGPTPRSSPTTSRSTLSSSELQKRKRGTEEEDSNRTELGVRTGAVPKRRVLPRSEPLTPRGPIIPKRRRSSEEEAEGEDRNQSKEKSKARKSDTVCCDCQRGVTDMVGGNALYLGMCDCHTNWLTYVICLECLQEKVCSDVVKCEECKALYRHFRYELDRDRANMEEQEDQAYQISPDDIGWLGHAVDLRNTAFDWDMDPDPLPPNRIPIFQRFVYILPDDERKFEDIQQQYNEEYEEEEGMGSEEESMR